MNDHNSNPVQELASLTRSWRRAAILGGIGLVLACVWAFWPLRTPLLAAKIDIPKGPTPSARIAMKPLDLESFGAPVWRLPAKPLVVAPPPPINMKLIAIECLALSGGSESPTYAALVYDAATDSMLTVRLGDRLAGRAVTGVNAASVTIDDGPHGQRVLTLDAGVRGSMNQTELGSVSP